MFSLELFLCTTNSRNPIPKPGHLLHLVLIYPLNIHIVNIHSTYTNGYQQKETLLRHYKCFVSFVWHIYITDLQITV